MMSATPATPAERAPDRRAWRLDGRTSARVRAFLSWWGAALSAWLPARVRELFGLASRRLLLVGNGGDIALQLQDADGVRDLASVPRASFDDTAGDPLAALLAPRTIDLPRWLLLPARAGLRRRLTLPEAAGDRLYDVLGFEIDRQTPFATADVRYDHRVLGRRGDGQIDVELVVVPRAAIDAQLAALGPLAPLLAGIDLDGESGPLGVNLIDDARRRRRREDPQRRLQLMILGIAVLLTAFGLWQMRENRSAAADALDARVAAEATRARAASAQRQQLTDLREGMAFLQAQRAARPLTVAVLDELARRLPDSTSLEKAAIEGDRVLLIGLSTEASALVGQLSGSTLWRAPALAGALQNDPRTRSDRFTLTAELVPPPAAPVSASTPPQEPVRADDAR